MSLLDTFKSRKKLFISIGASTGVVAIAAPTAIILILNHETDDEKVLGTISKIKFNMSNFYNGKTITQIAKLDDDLTYKDEKLFDKTGNIEISNIKDNQIYKLLSGQADTILARVAGKAVQSKGAIGRAYAASKVVKNLPKYSLATFGKMPINQKPLGNEMDMHISKLQGKFRELAKDPGRTISDKFGVNAKRSRFLGHGLVKKGGSDPTLTIIGLSLYKEYIEQLKQNTENQESLGTLKGYAYRKQGYMDNVQSLYFSGWLSDGYDLANYYNNMKDKYTHFLNFEEDKGKAALPWLNMNDWGYLLTAWFVETGKRAEAGSTIYGEKAPFGFNEIGEKAWLEDRKYLNLTTKGSGRVRVMPDRLKPIVAQMFRQRLRGAFKDLLYVDDPVGATKEKDHLFYFEHLQFQMDKIKLIAEGGSVTNGIYKERNNYNDKVKEQVGKMLSFVPIKDLYKGIEGENNRVYNFGRFTLLSGKTIGTYQFKNQGPNFLKNFIWSFGNTIESGRLEYLKSASKKVKAWDKYSGLYNQDEKGAILALTKKANNSSKYVLTSRKTFNQIFADRDVVIGIQNYEDTIYTRADATNANPDNISSYTPFVDANGNDVRDSNGKVIRFSDDKSTKANRNLHKRSITITYDLKGYYQIAGRIDKDTGIITKKDMPMSITIEVFTLED